MAAFLLHQGLPTRGVALTRLKSNLVVLIALLAVGRTDAYSQLLQWLADPRANRAWKDSASAIFWISILATIYFAWNTVQAAYYVKYATVPLASISLPAPGTPAADAARRAMLSKSSPLTRGHPPLPSTPLFPVAPSSPLSRSTSNAPVIPAASRGLPSPSPSVRQMLQSSTSRASSVPSSPGQSQKGPYLPPVVPAGTSTSPFSTPTKRRTEVGQAAVLAYKGRHQRDGLSRSLSARRAELS